MHQKQSVTDYLSHGACSQKVAAHGGIVLIHSLEHHAALLLLFGQLPTCYTLSILITYSFKDLKPGLSNLLCLKHREGGGGGRAAQASSAAKDGAYSLETLRLFLQEKQQEKDSAERQSSDMQVEFEAAIRLISAEPDHEACWTCDVIMH